MCVCVCVDAKSEHLQVCFLFSLCNRTFMHQWHPLGPLCGVCVHWTVYRIFPSLCLFSYFVAAVWWNSHHEWHLAPHLYLLFYFSGITDSILMHPSTWDKTTTESVPSGVITFPVSSHHLAVSQPRRLTDRKSDWWQAVRDGQTAAGLWIDRQEAFISQQKKKMR